MRWICCWVFALVSSVFFAYAGGEGVGGGSSIKMEADRIRYLLENGDVKQSLMIYLKSIQLDNFPTKTPNQAAIKELFRQVLENNGLISDIQTPNNYVFNQGCPEAPGRPPSQIVESKASLIGESNYERFACTPIGVKGGSINFEIKKLSEYYKGLNNQELLIRLASLAIHEHIHHFQNPAVELQIHENEAYALSDYVYLTADRNSQVWVPSLYEEMVKPMSVVRYYNKADSESIADSPYIKVTKTKDFHLIYEKCFQAQCSMLSERRLNIFEAWSWGEYLTSEKAYSRYVIALFVAPVVFVIGGRTLPFFALPWVLMSRFRALGLIFQFQIVKHSARIGALSSVLFDFSAMEYNLKKRTEVETIAAQNSSTPDSVIYQSMHIDQLASELTEFIRTAPSIPLSQEGLRDWDSNQ
jgi:hypothetical protein